MTSIVPVILSGGSGSRLWPISRLDRPKQFIPGLVANRENLSLFQLTLRRLESLGNQATKPVVVCNTEHRFLVSEQLKEIGIDYAQGYGIGRPRPIDDILF